MFQSRQFIVAAVAATVLAVVPGQFVRAADTIRVATYNTSLYRDHDGQLIQDLEPGDNPQARQIAEVIQCVRPDVLFVNEFDYDEAGKAAELFRTKYLAVAQNGLEPIKFEYFYTGPVNTGVPSGRDLSHDKRRGDANDAFGYGKHPGEYGMLVLSKFPIDKAALRTFQKFLWRDMPNAKLPINPKTNLPFYDQEDMAIFRLSSKSFWDVPINVPAEGTRLAFTLHVLASHPTPPVFDGPEDRNGCRNHDEIRLIADYISPTKGAYIKDDAGKAGGLAPDANFVVVGDLNCDPVDGEGIRGTMDFLLESPRVNATFAPTSEGGPLTVAKFSEQFAGNQGDPARVTANFTGEKHGCLRIDYVLPSSGLKIVDGAVFWPKPGEPGAEAITATDHRSVWLDIQPKK